MIQLEKSGKNIFKKLVQEYLINLSLWKMFLKDDKTIKYYEIEDNDEIEGNPISRGVK